MRAVQSRRFSGLGGFLDQDRSHRRAGSSISASLARLLAEDGYRVALASRNPANLTRLASVLTRRSAGLPGERVPAGDVSLVRHYIGPGLTLLAARQRISYPGNRRPSFTQVRSSP